MSNTSRVVAREIIEVMPARWNPPKSFIDRLWVKFKPFYEINYIGHVQEARVILVLMVKYLCLWITYSRALTCNIGHYQVWADIFTIL